MFLLFLVQLRCPLKVTRRGSSLFWARCAIWAHRSLLKACSSPTRRFCKWINEFFGLNTKQKTVKKYERMRYVVSATRPCACMNRLVHNAHSHDDVRSDEWKREKTKQKCVPNDDRDGSCLWPSITKSDWLWKCLYEFIASVFEWRFHFYKISMHTNSNEYNWIRTFGFMCSTRFELFWIYILLNAPRTLCNVKNS